ncbi:MAG: hypothetical protein V1656_02580 [Candidatus Jorgensenbacteria bacterium]
MTSLIAKNNANALVTRLEGGVLGFVAKISALQTSSSALSSLPKGLKF